MVVKEEPDFWATVGELREYLAAFEARTPLLVVVYGNITYGHEVDDCDHDDIAAVNTGMLYLAGRVAPVTHPEGLDAVAILVDMVDAPEREL